MVVRWSQKRGLADGRSAEPGCQFDLRWWIEARDTQQTPPNIVWTGRSAELALACAMYAAAKGEPLDQQVSASACFKQPQSSSFHLTSVGSIDHKLLGVRRTQTGQPASRVDEKADFTTGDKGTEIP